MSTRKCLYFNEGSLSCCNLSIYGRYSTEPFRFWANLLPGANRPVGPWPIRSLTNLLPGTKVVGNYEVLVARVLYEWWMSNSSSWIPSSTLGPWLQKMVSVWRNSISGKMGQAIGGLPDTSAPRQFGTSRELVPKCHGILRHQCRRTLRHQDSAALVENCQGPDLQNINTIL